MVVDFYAELTQMYVISVNDRQIIDNRLMAANERLFTVDFSSRISNQAI